jgi:hypothetical protein
LAGIVIKIKSPPPVISTGGGLIIADFKDLLGQQPPCARRHTRTTTSTTTQGGRLVRGRHHPQILEAKGNSVNRRKAPGHAKFDLQASKKCMAGLNSAFDGQMNVLYLKPSSMLTHRHHRHHHHAHGASAGVPV